MPAPEQAREETMPSVFVVDDDVNVRGALARLLRSLGMQVETFASARDFLGCQRPDGPACLILDVRLTGEDGLRVQDALRTAAWRPPIIFLTGHGTVPLGVRALKGGPSMFSRSPSTTRPCWPRSPPRWSRTRVREPASANAPSSSSASPR